MSQTRISIRRYLYFDIEKRGVEKKRKEEFYSVLRITALSHAVYLVLHLNIHELKSKYKTQKRYGVHY